MNFTKLAGLAAVCFAAIVAGINVALSTAGWPLEATATPGEVATYFATHRTLLGLDVTLSLVNTVLIATFGAGAFATIWRAERERDEAWSAVGLIGVAVMTALFTTVVGTRGALSAGHDPSGGLWNLHNTLFTSTGVGLGIILLGFSVGGVRTATIPRWQGVLGVASAALLIVSAALTPVTVDGPAWLAVIGLVGFAGWLVWLAAFGVVLLRHDRIHGHPGSTGPGHTAALRSQPEASPRHSF